MVFELLHDIENNIINSNFSIPNTVTSIGSGAFTDNDLTGSTAFIYARNADGSIDLRHTAAMIELAYPMEVTFHRAFDRCRDPFETMEQLINIGCNRILTSGQMPVVDQGIELLAKLNEAADERIIIMPGSGVRKDNIRQLQETTGCREFHSSLRTKKRSAMEFIHAGFANSEENYLNNHIDPSEVRALRNALA